MHFSQIEAALDIRNERVMEEGRGGAILDVVRKTQEDYSFGLEDLRRIARNVASTATRAVQTDFPNADPVTEPEILEAIESLEGTDEEQGETAVPSAEELMLQEWAVLTRDSHRTERGVASGPISVRAEPIATDSVLSGLIDGVFLVDRLREVRAFVGFRRVSPEGRLVYPNLGSNPPVWLPAVEVFGEGFFVRFDHDALFAWERRNATHLERRLRDIRARLEEPDEFAIRFSDRAATLPRFVLVHTFAHLLMLELCYECGYSSASLRERLYVFPDRAGVLIYTADGDSEGSLGGLVRQGTIGRLEKTISSAVRRASWCSNDPVCRELTGRGPAKTNLAACHACALVSETSCTELNGLLDRMLLVGLGDDSGPGGYFEGLLGG